MPAHRLLVGIRFNYLTEATLFLLHTPQTRALKQAGVLSSYWSIVLGNETESAEGVLIGLLSSIDLLYEQPPNAASKALAIGASFACYLGYNFAKLF